MPIKFEPDSHSEAVPGTNNTKISELLGNK